MAETVLLLKLAGEIQLKSHFVRAGFTKRLGENIKEAFKRKKLGFERMERKAGKLVIHSKNPAQLIPVLQKVFGISSISLAEKTSSPSLEEIASLAAEYSQKVLRENDSFAVRANRLGKHQFSSRDIEVACGSAIQERFPGAKVNLSAPEKTVFVELDGTELLLYSEKISGAKGLPLGVEGFLPVLFEGKKGEEKSAWLVMKRGCKITALLLKENNAVKKALKNLLEWNNFSPIKTEKISSLKELKKFKAVVVGETGFSRESIEKIRKLSEENDLMVFSPLILHPKELSK